MYPKDYITDPKVEQVQLMRRRGPTAKAITHHAETLYTHNSQFHARTENREQVQAYMYI